MYTDAATWSLCAAVVAALALAWRRPAHRAFAAVLLLLAILNAMGLALDARYGLSARPVDAPPLEGSALVAHDLDTGAELLASGALASCLAWYFAGWRWRGAALILGAAIVGAVYLASVYPAIRGDDLRRFLLATEEIALFACAASVVAFWWRRPAVTTGHVGSLLLAAGALATWFGGAWQRGYFGPAYALVQVGLVTLYSILTVFQIGAFTWTFFTNQRS